MQARLEPLVVCPITDDDLQQWQRYMGYTQQQAAQALGVSQATYCDWLAGMSRTTGKPVHIDKRTELACAALAAGFTHYAPPPS
ncbi:XRE family transcriptional regulator [Comamonadaceae bacterium OH3737_COT-264]|nr:XRE family transcriptional regulator [Comamonadaceae bacterium OH3737_COT-264]